MKLKILKKQTFSLFNLLTYLHWFKVGTECWFFLRRLYVKSPILTYLNYQNRRLPKGYFGAIYNVENNCPDYLGSNLGFIWNKVFILFCYLVHITDGCSETPCTSAHKYT